MNRPDGFPKLLCGDRIKICTKSGAVQKICIFFNQPAAELKIAYSSRLCGGLDSGL
jgi:hypothetical protein